MKRMFALATALLLRYRHRDGVPRPKDMKEIDDALAKTPEAHRGADEGREGRPYQGRGASLRRGKHQESLDEAGQGEEDPEDRRERPDSSRS